MMIVISSIQKSVVQPLPAARGFCGGCQIFSISTIMIKNCAVVSYFHLEQKAISRLRFANHRESSGGGVSYQRYNVSDIFHIAAHHLLNLIVHNNLQADRGSVS